MGPRQRCALVGILALAITPSLLRPQTPAALSLDLNVPAFRLDVFERDSLRLTIKVAVGMPRYRTPRGEYVITSIEWNPWWIPPKSEWARKEKVTPPGASNPMGAVKLYFQHMYFLHGTPFVESLGRRQRTGA
jgi:murein L,D-transpeptidase YcbB/YkuD